MSRKWFHALTRILAASVLGLGVFAILAPVSGEAEAACVIGVRSNDVLNMRADATTASRIVAVIPPGGCGVIIIERAGNWLYVRYGGSEGWVSARFIADGASGEASACVIGVRRNDVLNIRRGRGTGTAIVGIIPPDGCGVQILAQRGGWARIRYRGVTGWVSSKFLAY